MSSNLIPFTYEDQPVRVVEVDGEPWFVLADLCDVLGLTSPAWVLRRLSDGVSSTHPIVDSLGRTQHASIVNEPGMYEVVIRSDKPEAVAFRRWVTAEVLPSIRRTGAYGVPQLSGPELMAAALIEAQRTLEAAETRANEAEIRAIEAGAKVLELTPKAAAWESFMSTTGDYSVNETAKILSRHHGINTGEKRLRALLENWGWIYRLSGIPRAMQTQVDCGRLTERARFHFHPTSGEKVADPPQVRITPKGVDAIYKRMNRGTLLESA